MAEKTQIKRFRPALTDPPRQFGHWPAEWATALKSGVPTIAVPMRQPRDSPAKRVNITRG